MANWQAILVSNFFAFVLGALSSLCIVILVEWVRKPRLRLEIAPSRDQVYTNGYPAGKVRFLELTLRNSALPRWLGWMSRSPASSCRAIIDFLTPDRVRVFNRSMAARWSASPQPVPLEFRLGDLTAAIMDPNRFNLASEIDVPAGEAESMGVVGRFDDDSDCYGWSNESYFGEPPWRNQDWRLPKGAYLVQVTVRASGEKCPRVFRLLNDGPVNELRLESVS
jgi:hypothetical protein